ncbi:MAG: histidine kinase [Burkholderiaceae bacterium]|nr:histidine kinase [Burkholderiaceae bacterium]
MDPIVVSEYRPYLVAMSFILAFVGSLLALTVTRHIRRKDGTLRLQATLTAGVALGGIGVWSMHFVGMVALQLDVASSYGILESAVSLLAAVLCTAAALAVVSKDPKKPLRILSAGLLLGLGVATMHYLGMYGMKIGGYVKWDLGTVGVSILIAIAAGTAALWLAFNTRSMSSKVGASVLMAAAVCAMHYTGMGAAEFVCTTANRYATIQGTGLVNALGLGSVVAACAFAMALLISLELYQDWMHHSLTRKKKHPV